IAHACGAVVVAAFVPRRAWWRFALAFGAIVAIALAPAISYRPDAFGLHVDPSIAILRVSALASTLFFAKWRCDRWTIVVGLAGQAVLWLMTISIATFPLTLAAMHLIWIAMLVGARSRSDANVEEASPSGASSTLWQDLAIFACATLAGALTATFVLDRYF